MQFKDRKILNLFTAPIRQPGATDLPPNRPSQSSAGPPRLFPTTRSSPASAQTTPPSLQVAARTGLHRAEHLDTSGEDGLDWIFTSNGPEAGSPY